MGFPGDGSTRLPDQGQKRKDDMDHGMGSKVNAIESNIAGDNPRDNVVVNAEGGPVIDRMYDWSIYENEWNTHRVCKRSILSTGVMQGTDGQTAGYSTTLVLPFNMMEYWLCSNLSPSNIPLMAHAVRNNNEGLYRIVSCKVRLSNLIIYEDDVYVAAGQEVSKSTENNNVYCLVMEHHQDNIIPMYHNCTISTGAAAALGDNTIDVPTSMNFTRGEICDKSNQNDFNNIAKVSFWRPGDPAREYSIPVDSSRMILGYNPTQATVRQIPLMGNAGYSTFTSTYGMSSGNPNITTQKHIKYATPTFKCVKIGVPRISAANGKDKKFRISMMMEQECVVQKRGQLFQDNNIDNYHCGATTTLVTIPIDNIAGLNPPVNIPNGGTGYGTFAF